MNSGAQWCIDYLSRDGNYKPRSVKVDKLFVRDMFNQNTIGRWRPLSRDVFTRSQTVLPLKSIILLGHF